MKFMETPGVKTIISPFQVEMNKIKSDDFFGNTTKDRSFWLK